MECEYFKSFRYFEPVIESGVVTHRDNPDFQVKFGDRIVGVEVMRLFKLENRRNVESSKERILEEVCRKAQERNLPTAHVTLFFNLRRPLNTASRRCIANAVVDVVAARMPPDGQRVELEGALGQPREVDLITVNRVHSGARGNWRWSELGTIEGDAVQVVQQAIEKKSVKLLSYRKYCEECWLLLVADSFRTSGKMAFGDSFKSHVFISPFDRTYVLDFGRGLLYKCETELR